MDYIAATDKNADEICRLVRNTVTTVYPRYYPMEVVRFICEYHDLESIRNDISLSVVGMLMEDGQLIGTGSYHENHITRAYVNPEFQRMGYGSRILLGLEKKLKENFDEVDLDASLPAVYFYEQHGYATQRHECIGAAHGAVLVYESMKKL